MLPWLSNKLRKPESGPLADSWKSREFALATVHRAENTDDPERLRAIVNALDKIARTICPVVWPMHPRTKKKLADLGLSTASISAIQPVSPRGTPKTGHAWTP